MIRRDAEAVLATLDVEAAVPDLVLPWIRGETPLVPMGLQGTPALCGPQGLSVPDLFRSILHST